MLRALSETQPLSLGEARRAAADLAGAGLMGTAVEMAYLAERLRGRAVNVLVEDL